MMPRKRNAQPKRLIYYRPQSSNGYDIGKGHILSFPNNIVIYTYNIGWRFSR